MSGKTFYTIRIKNSDGDVVYAKCVSRKDMVETIAREMQLDDPSEITEEKVEKLLRGEKVSKFSRYVILEAIGPNGRPAGPKPASSSTPLPKPSTPKDRSSQSSSSSKRERDEQEKMKKKLEEEECDDEETYSTADDSECISDEEDSTTDDKAKSYSEKEREGDCPIDSENVNTKFVLNHILCNIYKEEHITSGVIAELFNLLFVHEIITNIYFDNPNSFYFYEPTKKLWIQSKKITSALMALRRAMKDLEFVYVDTTKQAQQTESVKKNKQLFLKMKESIAVFPELLNKLEKEPFIKSCLQECTDGIYKKDNALRFNTKSKLLPLLHGRVINLVTGEVRERTMKDMFSVECATDYNPNARSKRFDTFISLVNCEDPIRERNIQLAMGIWITGENTRKVFICRSAGGNAKSIISKMMKTTPFHFSLTCLPFTTQLMLVIWL